MTSRRPYVGIVTVTYNSAKVLSGFLHSLQAQTFTHYTLLIIDNASTDDTISIAKCTEDPRITLISNHHNAGFAAGSNSGIRAALSLGCTHVLLINNDTVFPSNLLEALLSAESTLRSQITVPKIYYYDRPSTIWAAGGSFNRLRGLASFHYGDGQLDHGQFNHARPVEFAPGCCMLIERSAIERVGLLDEDYFVYTEDADYCWRARSHGVRIFYTPTAEIYHKVSSLTGGATSPFVIRYSTRNRVLFLRKHLPSVVSYAWLFCLQILIHWRALTGGDTWQKYRVKQDAFKEGLNLPIKPSPIK